MTAQDWDAFTRVGSSIETISADHFTRRVAKGGFFGLFIEPDMVGHMNLNLYGDDEGHFQSIYIDLGHRGKGLSNTMMAHALNWYRERDVKRVHLYTDVDNDVAHSLYKKYGFTVDSRSWHFIVPFSTINPSSKYTSHEILEEDIDAVGSRFQRLPAGEIRRWLNNESRMSLMLKDTQGRIVGACLFMPSFPGCRPFEISTVSCFDDFIVGIKARSLPQFDFVKLTFAGDDELAGLCKQRGYELVHEMLYFTQDL
jgi:GNAT superfamily N-acetyltransferase